MKKNDLRLDNYDKNLIDRSKQITFYFENKPLVGYEGETIGVALWANGVRYIDNSIKYHRPRGLMTLRPIWEMVHVRVNGISHVNPAVELLRDGMYVEKQSRISPLIKAFVNRIDISPTRYYIELAKPRIVRNLMISLSNKIMGVPEPPKSKPKIIQAREMVHKDVEIVILGASYSGLKLAKILSENELSVSIITPERFLGGASYYRGNGKNSLTKLIKELKSKGNVTISLESKIVGLHENREVVVLERINHGYQYTIYKNKVVVIAFDPVDRVPLFYNNDLPGIIFTDMAYRLINIYGVKPGDNVVILGAGRTGLDLASKLKEVGVNVKALVDFTKEKNVDQGDVYWRHTVHRAIGDFNIKAVEIAKVDSSGRPLTDSVKRLECDTLIIATGYRPFFELPAQLKPKLRYVEEVDSFAPIRNTYFETTVKGLYVIGDIIKFNERELYEKIAELASVGILNNLGKAKKEDAKEHVGEFHSIIEELDLETAYSKVIVE